MEGGKKEGLKMEEADGWKSEQQMQVDKVYTA